MAEIFEPRRDERPSEKDAPERVVDMHKLMLERREEGSCIGPTGAVLDSSDMTHAPAGLRCVIEQVLSGDDGWMYPGGQRPQPTEATSAEIESK